MNFFIHQNIVIHTLRIDGISNSSVFQIGSAGVIKPLSNLYNTGGFTKPAPSMTPSGAESATGSHAQTATSPEAPPTPLVPLVAPS
jgi:spore germination protein PB